MTTTATQEIVLRIDAALSIHEETFTGYSRQDGVTEFLGAFAAVRYLGGEAATHLVVDVDMANGKLCIVNDDGGRMWLSLFDLECVEIGETLIEVCSR